MPLPALPAWLVFSGAALLIAGIKKAKDTGPTESELREKIKVLNSRIQDLEEARKSTRKLEKERADLIEELQGLKAGIAARNQDPPNEEKENAGADTTREVSESRRQSNGPRESTESEDNESDGDGNGDGNGDGEDGEDGDGDGE